MYLISSNGVKTNRRRRVSQIVALVAVTMASFAGVVSPASAQAVAVPRILPTAIPAGYKVNDYFDRLGPNRDVNFIHLLRDDTLTKEIFVNSTPIAKSSFDENVLPRQISNGAKKVKVRATKGALLVEGGDVRLDWFEKNRWLTAFGTNVPSKVLLAFANGIVPSSSPDASFALKKKPAGFATVYVGQIGGLSSSASGVLWTNSDSEEIELDVINAVPNYIDIVFLGPGTAFRPTTVNGKPGYVAERSGGTTVVWMDQPNLLVEVRSTQFNEAGIAAITASLAPVDEAAWAAATNPPDAPAGGSGGASGGSGGLPVNTAPVAAGTLNGVPWVATVNGQCLVFAAGTATAQTCLPAFTPPNSMSWTNLAASGKNFAVGITGANVVTVVAKANGAEVLRVATQPAANLPGLKYFIVELPAPAGVTFSGLDAAGAEIAPAIAAGTAVK